MAYGGSCGFDARSWTFCWDDKDECWFDAEGLCAGNSCLRDSGHCEPIFANRYDYVGKGFVAGMNGVAAVYNRGGVEVHYALPSAAHFDERVRIATADLDADGRHFNLMLEYHDVNETQRASVCYALYEAKATPMPVYVADGGYPGGWLGEGAYAVDSFSLMFLARFVPPTQCEPYAFVCRSDAGNFFRLPQDDRYFFGTDWLDWSWTDYAADYALDCREQHYFYDEAQNEWLVHGGSTRSGSLSKEQIWYYAQNGGECIGCGQNNAKLEVLQCLERCIRDDDLENCSCGTVLTTTQTTTAMPTNETTVQPATTISAPTSTTFNASAAGDLYVDIGRQSEAKRRYICDELNAGNVPFATTEPNTFVFEVRDAVIAVLCVVNAMLLAVLLCRGKGTKRQRYVKVVAQTDTDTDTQLV